MPLPLPLLLVQCQHTRRLHYRWIIIIFFLFGPVHASGGGKREESYFHLNCKQMTGSVFSLHIFAAAAAAAVAGSITCEKVVWQPRQNVCNSKHTAHASNFVRREESAIGYLVRVNGDECVMDVNRFSSSSFMCRDIEYGLFAFELDVGWRQQQKRFGIWNMQCACGWRPHELNESKWRIWIFMQFHLAYATNAMRRDEQISWSDPISGSLL